MKHHHLLLLLALLVARLPAAALQAQPETAPAPYPARAAYAPRPLPDRIVLTGHVHTYARTGEVAGRSQDGAAELRAGYHQTYDPAVGTVYVVSVSGPGFHNIAAPSGPRGAARTFSSSKSPPPPDEDHETPVTIAINQISSLRKSNENT